MTTQTQEIATTLWMSDRDMDSLRLAKEVDGDRTAGDQIRKALGSYFATVGDVSAITTYEQGEEWAQNLRVEGRFPAPKIARWPEAERQVLSRLVRPQLLGLNGLTTEYIKVTSPAFADVISLYREQLQSRAAAPEMPPPLDIAARGCIDGKKLEREYSRVFSWFSAAAISDYFDTRSQEDGFVASMQGIAEEQREEFRREGFPAPHVELRPWEVAK